MLKCFWGICAFAFLAPVLFAQIPHTVAPETSDAWLFQTGNDLYMRCAGGRTMVVDSPCLLYIAGAVDMIGALQGSHSEDHREFWRLTAVCLPNQATSGQIADVVMKYLQDHPEERTDKASWIIVRALIKAWGCPASKVPVKTK